MYCVKNDIVLGVVDVEERNNDKYDELEERKTKKKTYLNVFLVLPFHWY